MDADWKDDTWRHIHRVSGFLLDGVRELALRASRHDQSKFSEEEAATFGSYTKRLAGMTVGSPEYEAAREEMAEALEHHYRENDHHPEHFGEDGINGMDLLQLFELVCDWTAAAERHTEGSIEESLEKLQERFGYDDQLKGIMRNTVDWLQGAR